TVWAGTLDLDSASGFTLANPLTLNDGSTVLVTGGGSFGYSQTNNPVIGLGASTALQAATGSTLTISSSFTNVGNTAANPTITVNSLTNTGMVMIDGDSSNFRGNWVLNGGTLEYGPNSTSNVLGVTTTSGSLISTTLTLNGGMLLHGAAEETSTFSYNY